jgi:hypothetical protein
MQGLPIFSVYSATDEASMKKMVEGGRGTELIALTTVHRSRSTVHRRPLFLARRLKSASLGIVKGSVEKKEMLDREPDLAQLSP